MNSYENDPTTIFSSKNNMITREKHGKELSTNANTLLGYCLIISAVIHNFDKEIGSIFSFEVKEIKKITLSFKGGVMSGTDNSLKDSRFAFPLRIMFKIG
ncbi:hypothetical protein EVAR_23196_1 [Eumeta japonica]|uniref:Uncharacterized protein n=1 Tax=Eumeta variegata TaxID=151549 RepID=A0A4C1VFX4_EUMVA|nr:hypothetical protein EVAR_23196_1 [Eumeta japonica]